jgi:hypothetical protein
MKMNHVSFIFFLLFVLSCVACTPGIRLNTRAAQAPEVTGTYTVIFYGCNYLDDLHTIAFLDKEGDKYTFDPYTSDFNYRVRKGLDAKDALEEAGKFVRCNTSFSHAQLSTITAPGGATLGYEVRPLYLSFTYGVGDVLYTDYRIKGDKVVLTISLVPFVEKMLESSGRQREER